VPGSDSHPRVVTLTLNPALDVACTAPAVRPTHKIRTSDERLDPGGGGINVARVLRAMGADPLALIMTGGATGQIVEELLDQEGVRWRSLPINGRTRISLSVHDRQSGFEYRFVARGPELDAAEWRSALDLLNQMEADWIVASGSLPPGVPADFYAQAASIAAQRGQKFVLDTSGDALQATVGRGIELLKLSLGELEFLTGAVASRPEQQEKEVMALHARGAARLIAVSLGSDGALLGTENGVTRLSVPPVKQQSTVGAGDSFLAGMVLGLSRGMSGPDALALAVAAGSAAVASYGTALVRRRDVEALFRQLRPASVTPALP
jgi:6-phosphofructokinase 2